MSKLKNLQQLKEHLDMAKDGSGYMYNEGQISLHELRNEAIKHCKHFIKYKYVAELFAFMTFFNITEDDLK